jgi:hypothetical protein
MCNIWEETWQFVYTWYELHCVMGKCFICSIVNCRMICVLNWLHVCAVFYIFAIKHIWHSYCIDQLPEKCDNVCRTDHHLVTHNIETMLSFFKHYLRAHVTTETNLLNYRVIPLIPYAMTSRFLLLPLTHYYMTSLAVYCSSPLYTLTDDVKRPTALPSHYYGSVDLCRFTVSHSLSWLLPNEQIYSRDTIVGSLFLYTGLGWVPWETLSVFYLKHYRPLIFS